MRYLRCEDTSAVTINCLRVRQDDTQQVDGPSQRSRKLLRLPNRRNRYASLLSIPKESTDIRQAGGTKNKWSSLSSSPSRFTVYPVPTPTCSLWFLRTPMLPPPTPLSARNAPLSPPPSSYKVFEEVEYIYPL